MVKYSPEMILTSFHYGPKLPRKVTWFIMMPFIVLVATFAILFIALCVTREEHFADSDVIAVFCLMLAFTLILCIFPILHIRRRIIDKKIELWLTDEQLIDRFVHPFMFSSTGWGPFEGCRIGIKFRVGDTKYLKISKHYENLFRLYKDRPMHILYSPKYDEVLVLQE